MHECEEENERNNTKEKKNNSQNWFRFGPKGSIRWPIKLKKKNEIEHARCYKYFVYKAMCRQNIE